MVADVLDAVHLLLALPLFVVIVGVDPRWLKRSLHERHPILLESVSPNATWTSPTDYLEKIFQLTYTLPRMNSESCADLLVGAAQDTQSFSAPQGVVTADLSERKADSDSIDSSFVNDIKDDVDGPLKDIKEESTLTWVSGLAEALTLRDDDMKALRNIAPLVATSPRRTKRFLNIYLVVRARAQSDPELRKRLSGEGDMTTIDSNLLVLVALMTGLPKTMSASLKEGTQPETGDPITLGTSLTRACTVPEEQTRLREFLASASSAASLPIDKILEWLPMVGPYLPLSLEDLQSP